MPGMQKPHWTPPSRTKASPITRRVSSGSALERDDLAAVHLLRLPQAGERRACRRSGPGSSRRRLPARSRSWPRRCRTPRAAPRAGASRARRRRWSSFPFRVKRNRGHSWTWSSQIVTPLDELASRTSASISESARLRARHQVGRPHAGALEDRQVVHQPLVVSAGGARRTTPSRQNIKIHDVTLRDGEQQTAVVFRREEKVAIAKKLDSLGIHRIEAGMPAVSPQDKAAISDIAALGLKAEIFGFARCIPAEIEGHQGVRLLGRRHRDSRQRPHDQVRLRLADRARDEGVDRDDARRQGSRALHRLLHDRRHPHRAQSLPRHRRAGGHRRAHGRADDGRHDGRLHARRGVATS